MSTEFWSDQPGALSAYYSLCDNTGYLYQDRRLHADNDQSPGLAETPGSAQREQAAEEQRSNFLPQDFLRISEVEMRGSEDVATGTVLQRLIQEQLRYGNPNENMNLLAIQHQATGSAGPTTNIAGNPASSTENLIQEDPQMVNQSARQEPQGQEHQVDNTVMEKTLRTSQPQQNNEDLPTYEEAKVHSQFFRVQPGPIGPGFYVAGIVANHKSKTEGRPTVSRANSSQAHQDEALKELKQGHVRSMSERIMLSLERNGVKQHSSTSGSIKGLRNGARSPAPSLGKGMEQRGPPPDYPHMVKQAAASANKISEQGHYYNEHQHLMVHEVKKPYPASQAARTEVSVLRYQPPPEYNITSRQQPFPSLSLKHHSPMSSQASSISGSLHSASLPLFPMGVAPHPAASPSPSPSQQLPPEAFAIVERAHQMVEMLTKENGILRQHLETCYEKADKLQKFETEIQKISEAYESLVKSSTKREALDKAMKNKLEGEIRRLHDFNLDLRDRLDTANRQLANRDYNGHEHISEEGHYAVKNKEHLMEGLERELTALRATNDDQRRHIEILDQALNNAQAKVVKLEEELCKKQVYVEEVEKLQQALTQLQAAGEKREQLERRLRTRLERELESLRMQQRHANCQVTNSADSSAPAIMDLLRKKEETILALEADTTKWEQKYLEESAMRHFTMDAASTAVTQPDTALNHSRSGSHTDNSLESCMWHDEEEIVQANRKFQDMEHTIKNLHAKIIEQDAMIKVLHQRSRKDPGKSDGSSLRPACSVPSIAAVTAATSGTHSRQTSQTSLSSSLAAKEKKEEKAWKGSIGPPHGKDNHESPSPSLMLPLTSFLLPPPPSAQPVMPAHAKTGSKDNSTQTDKNSNLFWPTCSSLPGRGRINMTPSSSPILRRTTRDKSDHSPVLGKTLDPVLGKTLELLHGKILEPKGRASATTHKSDLSEPENTMEVLI